MRNETPEYSLGDGEGKGNEDYSQKRRQALFNFPKIDLIDASEHRRANCYDNAVAESFFATLRWELLDRQQWPTRTAARSAIFEYIEVWYNRHRRHSSLGYLSPLQFEQRLRSAA